MGSKTLWVIAGPTAVGKSAVALELAGLLNSAIISADSRQCYSEMTIGTAKPSLTDLQLVPHYFINSHSVKEDQVSAAVFERLAMAWLTEIFKDKDHVILCGGTGLYIDALCNGLDEMPFVPEEEVLAVQRDFEHKGLEWLKAEVATKCPLNDGTGEKNNPARLMRALAFYNSHGQTIATYKTGLKKIRPFSIKKIALQLPRSQLYERINNRVAMMMQEGLLEEVEGLLQYQDRKALQTVGYTELFNYLKGNCTLQESVEKIKQHSRNYAKRQLTWFRKDESYQWMDINDPNLIKSLCKRY